MPKTFADEVAETHKLHIDAAEKALSNMDDPDESTALVDLLADLMHYADRKGWGFDCALESARDHYRAELAEFEEAGFTPERECSACGSAVDSDGFGHNEMCASLN